jgi:hypothetical protein
MKKVFVLKVCGEIPEDRLMLRLRKEFDTLASAEMVAKNVAAGFTVEIYPTYVLERSAAQ